MDGCDGEETMVVVMVGLVYEKIIWEGYGRGIDSYKELGMINVFGFSELGVVSVPSVETRGGKGGKEMWVVDEL